MSLAAVKYACNWKLLTNYCHSFSIIIVTAGVFLQESFDHVTSTLEDLRKNAKSSVKIVLVGNVADQLAGKEINYFTAKVGGITVHMTIDLIQIRLLWAFLLLWQQLFLVSTVHHTERFDFCLKQT